MNEFVVVVPATDPQSAMIHFSNWLDKNGGIRNRLGEKDVIRYEIHHESGEKHEFQVRRSCIEADGCSAEDIHRLQG